MEDVRDDIRSMYAGMTREQRQCLVSIITQEFITSFPYYSKTVHRAPRTGVGPFTYTIARGNTIRAFSYAFNQLGVAAGFPAGYLTTLADTNLGKPDETISGESVEITGIAIQPVMGWVADKDAGANSITDELSDARLMALASDALSVILQLNAGQQDYRLGIFPMLPGAGGLAGNGFDSLQVEAIQGGRWSSWGNVTNGQPRHDNYFYMPEGIVWLPSGKRDSQLNVVYTAERAITAYSSGDSANNAALGANEVAGGGIRGYTYPTYLGFSLMTFLKGRTISKRSMVT